MHLPDLEQAAVSWLAGQHQPDSLAAVVVARDVLVHSAGRWWSIVSPVDIERRRRGSGASKPPPEWMCRSVDFGGEAPRSRH